MVEATTLPPGSATRSARGVVLVVDDDPTTRDLIVSLLQRNEYEVQTAGNGREALAQVAELAPDLVISDETMVDPGGFDFRQQLGSDGKTSAVPFIFMTALGRGDGLVRRTGTAADTYIAKPVRPPELVARVRAVLAQTALGLDKPRHERRSVQRSGLLSEYVLDAARTIEMKRTLLNEHAFDVECTFDVDRADRQRLTVSFAALELFELSGIRETFGERGQATIAREIALLIERFDSIARLGVDGNGRFLFLIAAPGATTREVLGDISRAIVAHRFYLGREPIRLTPIVGFAPRTDTSTVDEMRRRVSLALRTATAHLDLQPVCYTARLERPAMSSDPFTLFSRARAFLLPLLVPFQVVSTLVGCLFVPFIGYWFFAAHGTDISNAVYIVCVVMLLLTALGICWENVLALKTVDPRSAGVYPPASAIIAAYLPNEAATVIETVEAFLRVNYAADVQVILAYNTPRSLPMEEELRAIADRDPRFVPLRIHGSTSKAQNVNAALRIVRGAFVGVFDADHKPDPDSFTRAWDWLASGYDIVQGHCLIRNGDASFVAQLVAIEFESIYAVSHPGRTRMHGFGLFGGSNGYWKTDLLRQTRMHSFMLTEDIDSSLRVIEAGYRIATDRKLISRELAPLTIRAFWHQRLRWAQGWFQVSLKHLLPALRSPHLSVRQKAGIVHLLFWRECYVWVCVQVLPILAFWIFIRHDQLDWFVPIFFITTVLTTLTGPLQLLFTYVLADPAIRNRRRWFVTYLVVSLVFLSEFKNTITRLAQFKEAMQERAWHVTPRSVARRV